MTEEASAAMKAIMARRFALNVAPPRMMRAPGAEWDLEIQVALPSSYHETDRAYPVLWVTDGTGYFQPAAWEIYWMSFTGLIPEMIIVGVGYGAQTTMAEYSRRRIYDFTPGESLLFEDAARAAALRQAVEAAMLSTRGGGAPGFLDFLVGEVRNVLAAEYRMQADEHALFGHSAGGMFVGYALFARPDTFARYICASPCLYGSNYEIFKMEEQYAATHRDLKAGVFFGAGETEISTGACMSLVGSMVRMAETLYVRNYPSLKVTARIFPGETHNTVVMPILSWGVRALWADAK